MISWERIAFGYLMNFSTNDMSMNTLIVERIVLDLSFLGVDTIFVYLGSGGEKEQAAKASKLLDGSSEFVLTYEDKDGDWMLVGDVPWGYATLLNIIFSTKDYNSKVCSFTNNSS